MSELNGIRRVLTIQPSYATVMYRNIDHGSKLIEYKDDLRPLPKRTLKQKEAEKHLVNNQHLGQLSKKAYARIRKSLEWLEYIATTKYSSQGIAYKVQMVTLTIPSFSDEIEEKRLKKVLNQFLTYARLSYGLVTYVWKAELTKAGNLHYHILTPEILGRYDIQAKWNELLLKEGLLECYSAKFGGMSLEQYSVYRINQSAEYGQEVNIKKINAAYIYGCSSGWTNPKSVQIDTIPVDDSLNSYISKYISKVNKGDGGSSDKIIQGRIWGCSRNISMSNKLTIRVDPNDTKNATMLNELINVSRSYEDIIFKDDKGVERNVGYKLFFDSTVWNDCLVGSSIGELFADYVSVVRGGYMYVSDDVTTQQKVNDDIISRLKDKPVQVVKKQIKNQTAILF